MGGNFEMEKNDWLFCPSCNGKTRTQVRQDTTMTNFPLFCPKCKQVALVNVAEKNMHVISDITIRVENKGFSGMLTIE